MTWQNGRQLASITKTDLSASYSYGLDGIRVSKTVNGTATEYYWQNGLLQGQRTGNDSLLFLYNAGGTAYGMICKTGVTESTYYYLFNAQGDVIALLDSAGNCVAEYLYDEWGKLLSLTGSLADTIGLLNPIRYRGYYYDNETGFYYLQSRYYDPEIGRFINADGQLNDDILGNNLFTYCGNNPITRTDKDGQGWWVAAGALFGGLIGGVSKIVSNVSTGKSWNDGLLGAVAGGAVYGGVLASTCSVVAAGFTGAAAESIVNQVSSYIPKVAQANGNKTTKPVTKENVINSIGTAIADTAINGTVSTITGEIAGKIIPINNGWIKPQKFVSSFVGNYAVKSELQTLVQGSLLVCYEKLKHSLKQQLQQGQQPTVIFFPGTEVQTAG